MKATELLKKQHREVEKLFKQIENAKGEAKKAQLFEDLASRLAAHDAIERQIFYPACEKAMGMTDTLGEAYAEHGVVEFCLYEADQALGKDQFDFKVKALMDVVQHHVDEEEDEMLGKASKALGAELEEKLGTKMEAKFDEARGKDFRPPLHENLRQVLAGALKTKSPGAPKPATKKLAPKANKSKSNGARAAH